MKLQNLDYLINYVFHNLEKASDQELRLTIYLLSIFLFTNEKSCWIYLNEIENGRDLIGDDRRVKLLNGIGLNRSEILNAIAEVNRRGILSVVPQTTTSYMFKITINKTNDDYR